MNGIATIPPMFKEKKSSKNMLRIGVYKGGLDRFKGETINQIESISFIFFQI